MKNTTRLFALVALAIAPLAAVHAESAPVHLACAVLDPAAFADYVGNHHPTLVELQGHINCLKIVMPGETATAEYRSDNSRFFAEMDTFGRITGGRFR